MLNAKRIATLVTEYLRNLHGASPTVVAIQRLVETLFYASLKTEEGRNVACTAVFVGAGFDPETYDFRRLHRYRYVPLSTPFALTPRTLAKFSQAAPPWAACIAVRQTNDQFEICGLFDQEIHYQNALNREGEARFPRPGVFQVEITGPGTLTVYHDRKLLARLSHDRLVTSFPDVLNEGPIATALLRYIDKLEQRARRNLRKVFKKHDVDSFLVDAPNLWLHTLSRILLGIRRLHHGGAILLIPSKPTKDLSIGFPLLYDRVEIVLEQHLLASARWQAARNRMRNDYAEPGALLPAALVQDRRGAFNESEDAKKAELGCAAFISSLAGVDGLILFSGGLRVAGFGVEIKRGKDPTLALIARDAVARPSRLTSLNLSDLGTRHRSMMRYCDRHPGSIGFVISQDGDVRAMTKTKAGLVVWENIQLQEVEMPQQLTRTESQTRSIIRRCEDIEKQLPWSKSFEHASRDSRVQLKLWLTRSGDPLKVLMHADHRNGFAEIQVLFDTDGDVLLATTLNGQKLNDGLTRVQESTQYFRFWRLISMTRKTATLYPGATTASMKAVKAQQVDLSDFPGDDLRPTAVVDQVEGFVTAILANNHVASGYTLVGDGQSQFCFIQGTSSPSGRYALGFGLNLPILSWQELQSSCDLVFRREHYLASEGLEESVRNYVVELGTNKVLGETQCHYIGTRHNYNHRTCETIWSSNDRFLIQLFHGKWATMQASIVFVNEDEAVGLSVLPHLRQHANRFLMRRKDRAFRRFGAARFALSVFCNQITNAGLVTFEVFGQIPKSPEDETTFSVVERFRILNGAKGIYLKLIECRFGERLY
jgi:hypothetical protein